MLIRCCKADYRTHEQHKDDAVNRREIGERITAAIAMDIERPTEALLAEYRGFQLLLPAGMVYNSPRLIIRGKHDYRIDLSLSAGALSVMASVDHVLNGFKQRAAEVAQIMKDRTDELNNAREELAREDDLDQQIEAMRAKLAQLDKDLGVTDND